MTTATARHCPRCAGLLLPDDGEFYCIACGHHEPTRGVVALPPDAVARLDAFWEAEERAGRKRRGARYYGLKL